MCLYFCSIDSNIGFLPAFLSASAGKNHERILRSRWKSYSERSTNLVSADPLINCMSQASISERLKIWLAVCLPILFMAYVHLQAQIMMYRIEHGDLASRVTHIYGQPDKTERTMLFCDGIFKWEGDCPTQRHSLYHFYKTGIDRWVVFGYDAEHRVVFKTSGDL